MIIRLLAKSWLLIFVAACTHSAAVHAQSTEWVDYFGAVVINGQPAPSGTNIVARDPSGVACGMTVTSEVGQYGFMPVWRDDSFTVPDEGAVTGDLIRFYVNGLLAETNPVQVVYPPSSGNVEVALSLTTSCCTGTTGNIDGDADDVVDISDLTSLVDYLTAGGSVSGCDEENDVDNSAAVDISDLTMLVDFLFFDGTLPSCP